MRGDVQHTKDLKHKVEQTVQDTIVATRIVEGFRNPQQNGQYLKTHANFPLEFFNRVTEQMRERLRWYKTTIEVRPVICRDAPFLDAYNTISEHDALLFFIYAAYRAQAVLRGVTATIYPAMYGDVWSVVS